MNPDVEFKDPEGDEIQEMHGKGGNEHGGANASERPGRGRGDNGNNDEEESDPGKRALNGGKTDKDGRKAHYGHDAAGDARGTHKGTGDNPDDDVNNANPSDRDATNPANKKGLKGSPGKSPGAKTDLPGSKGSGKGTEVRRKKGSKERSGNKKGKRLPWMKRLHDTLHGGCKLYYKSKVEF